MRRDKHIVFDAWSALTVVVESVCVVHYPILSKALTSLNDIENFKGSQF